MKTLMTFKNAVEGKSHFLIVHQRRVGKGWESHITEHVVTEDIKAMFKYIHMECDGIVATSEWIHPNDHVYRISIQVRMQ